MIHRRPEVEKQEKAGSVYFTIYWSPLAKSDKYGIIKSVPSDAGIYELYAMDPKKKLMSHIWDDHLQGFAVERCGSAARSRPITSVNHHAVQDDNPKYSALKGTDRDGLRRHVQGIYITPEGKPATSAAPVLWSTSEASSPVPSTTLTLLRPVAMVVQAKPARAAAGAE